MAAEHRPTVLTWLKNHPGIFSYHEEGDALKILENFSQKSLTIRWNEIGHLEEKINTALPSQSYLVFLLKSERQLVLSLQGFVFPPNFTNTGPLPLPSQVFCMQDFTNLLHRLRHVASEAARRQEALDLIMILVTILDGARAVGLEVDSEEAAVEAILGELEKGNPTPSPH